MNALDLIARAQAAPLTHRVTTVYADGATKTHDTRSVGSAENHAVAERRKIGRALISRETGVEVTVVGVVVSEI